ncbi:hypothetical protein IFT59_07680 [Rhizobium sp. CFBP 8752]|uniref:hypothetical protein n=1 Tax=Rhizobium sp. CFBP 8752 TaxID=2775301 RepID=UPI0017827DA8|nr:hypothetical protein [Rhizobium sp. CFBP 8752]MBD8663132.1 hypothetical protein [Rhizobium sp. CFBP 8752]
MAVIDIPLTGFAPDLPPLGSSAFTRIHNATAGRGATQGTISLNSMKAASLYSNTSMDSRPIGSAVGQNRTGDAKVYAGNATKLYKLAPDTRAWTNISRSGGYTTSGTEKWKSIEFGSLSIFTNWDNEPQYIDRNVDTQFANLTTLVKGRHIATFKGFTLLGWTWDSLDGAVPYRVRWSGIENPADWTYSAATQADFQDIQGYGGVTGIVTDDSCYVLLQRGIVQMTYIGAPYVFQFTERSSKGCSVPESVITVQGVSYFLSDDGWYSLAGGQLQPIGTGIDQWFLDNFDASQAHLMTVAADPRETLIYWQVCSKDSIGGKPDLMLIYNYATGAWTTADATTNHICNAISLPWTVDQLDQFLSIDKVPSSFDDPIWSGGKSMLWGMSDTGAVYSFGGDTLEMAIESADYQLSKIVPNETGADIARVDAVRPLFEGDGQARVQVATRSLPNADLNWSEAKDTSSITGFAYHRSQSRYQRFRVTIDGEWRRCSGLQVDARSVGRR